MGLGGSLTGFQSLCWVFTWGEGGGGLGCSCLFFLGHQSQSCLYMERGGEREEGEERWEGRERRGGGEGERRERWGAPLPSPYYQGTNPGVWEAHSHTPIHGNSHGPKAPQHWSWGFNQDLEGHTATAHSAKVPICPPWSTASLLTLLLSTASIASVSHHCCIGTMLS